jgi:uncharacterized protein YggL (DUF469 family)
MTRLRKNWIIKGKLAQTVNTAAVEKLFDEFTDYVEQELDLLSIGVLDHGVRTFVFTIAREDESPVLIENKINQLKTWLTDRAEVTEVEIVVE